MSQLTFRIVTMAQIVLFHSALGLNDGMRRMAGVFTEAGHTVHTLDFYDGRVFDNVPDGIAYRDEVGFPALAQRASAAVEELGLEGPVYFGGFSLGAAMAQSFGKRHRQAAGAFLCHAGGVPKPTSWNGGCWLQMHYTQGDEWVDAKQAEILIDSARAAGAQASAHVYPGSAHLFGDPTAPEYSPELAQKMWGTILAAIS